MVSMVIRLQDQFLRRSYPCILLILSVFTGAILGVQCGFYPDSSASSLMRGCCMASVSIVCRCYMLLLPLFAVIPAALCSKPFGFIPICFLKAFLYSYCLAAVWSAFGQAGWLIGGFLLVSDSVSFLLVIRLGLRHICGFRDSIGYDIFKNSLFIIGVSLLECWFVTPFLVWIMNG